MLLTFLYVFSFLSFNTKAMMPGDKRLEPLVELVKNADADFVFLTEEYTGQVRTMLKDRYEHYEWATAHIDETERFFSKYPIVDVKEIGPVDNGNRADIWVHKVRVVAPENDTLNVYCCHLPHDVGQREYIVREILKDAGNKGKAIIGGDMNSLSISSPMIILANGGMRDVWVEKGRGNGATYHEFFIGLRIDYIFHSPDLRAQKATRISGAGISDHDAMYAEFTY